MKKEVGKGGKKGESKKIKYINENRGPKVVGDILNLKLKYAEKEWKSCRRKYRRKRKVVEALFPGKKERKFRNMAARIGRNMKVEWRKGTRRMEERLDLSQRKFRKAEV